MCGCVRVCVRVFARQGHRTISYSYVSPGDWTQVWRLTLRAITGSGMSYTFKILNLWAPCFSQSWVLESQAYATIPIVYLHTADYSQKACRPPHAHTHAHTYTHSRVHIHTCAHVHSVAPPSSVSDNSVTMVSAPPFRSSSVTHYWMNAKRTIFISNLTLLLSMLT